MVKEYILALYLTAGYLKADPRLAWLPIDLTLLLAVTVLGATLVQFIKGGLKIPRSIVFVLILFLIVLIPSSIQGDLRDQYAREKVMRMYTVTLLAALAPMFLIRCLESLGRFLNALGIIGILMAFDALVRLWTGEDISRLEAFGSNTIALGRAVGFSLMWVALHFLFGRASFPRAFGPLLLIPILIVALIGSGSRGPLVAVMFSLSLALFLFPSLLGRKVLVLGFAAIIGISGMFSFIPLTSLERIVTFLRGEVDTSGGLRLDAYALSIDYIWRNPIGLGLGGFAQISNLWARDVKLVYPHNIIVEVFLEGGWLAGIYTIVLLGFAVYKSYVLAKKHFTKESIGLFLGIAFYLINAMVSGDLNDNRLLFAVVGVGLRGLGPYTLGQHIRDCNGAARSKGENGPA